MLFYNMDFFMKFQFVEKYFLKIFNNIWVSNLKLSKILVDIKIITKILIETIKIKFLIGKIAKCIIYVIFFDMEKLKCYF